MNRRGFTLIELLAVIAIMAIVLVIAIPSSIDAYKKSRLKAEEVFAKRLSEQVDSYTSLNTEELNFNTNIGTKIKPDTDRREVTVYQDTITIENLINNKLIRKSDYINPNNKNEECNVNAEIEVYKDSDFVYCHRIKAASLNCITDEFINEYLEGNPESYIVDTCVWSDN